MYGEALKAIEKAVEYYPEDASPSVHGGYIGG